MTFKAIQTYSDGKVVSWIEQPAPGSTEEPDFPAPTLQLAAPSAAGGVTASSAPAAPATSDTASKGSVIGAYLLGGLGLLAGLAGLALGLTSRRRSTSAGDPTPTDITTPAGSDEPSRHGTDPPGRPGRWSETRPAPSAPGQRMSAQSGVLCALSSRRRSSPHTSPRPDEPGLPVGCQDRGEEVHSADGSREIVLADLSDRQTSTTRTAASSPGWSPAWSRPPTAGWSRTPTPTGLAGDCPDTVQPEPVAAGPADREPGPVRGDRGHLPGPRPGPVEHDARRGRHRRHRHRPADLRRGRRGRAGAVPRAPRRPAGDRGDLHPLAHRPLRWRARRGRRRHRRPDPRAGRVPRARRLARTSTPATAMLRRGMYHTGMGAAGRARPAQVGGGLGPATSTGTVGADRAHPGHHPHRPGGDRRRRPHRLPADARHRGARRR